MKRVPELVRWDYSLQGQETVRLTAQFHFSGSSDTSKAEAKAYSGHVYWSNYVSNHN